MSVKKYRCPACGTKMKVNVWRFSQREMITSYVSVMIYCQNGCDYKSMQLIGEKPTDTIKPEEIDNKLDEIYKQLVEKHNKGN